MDWRDVQVLERFSDYTAGETYEAVLRELTLQWGAAGASQQVAREYDGELNGLAQGAPLFFARQNGDSVESLGARFVTLGDSRAFCLVALRDLARAFARNWLIEEQLDDADVRAGCEYVVDKQAGGRPVETVAKPCLLELDSGKPSAAPPVGIDLVEFDPIIRPGTENHSAWRRRASFVRQGEGNRVEIVARELLRHRIEELFAFRARPDPASGNSLTAARACAVRVTVERPAVTSETEPAPLFGLVRLKRPEAPETIAFQPERLPAPQDVETKIEAVPRGIVETIESRIATEAVYAVTLDLARLGFLVERLFARGDETISVRVDLPEAAAGATGLQVRIVLIASDVPTLLATVEGAEYALVLQRDYSPLPPIRFAPADAVSLTLTNLWRDVLWLEPPQTDAPQPLQPSQSLDIPVDLENGVQTVSFHIDWGDEDASFQQVDIDIEAIAEAAQVVGVDVGTTAISIAYENVRTRKVERARLGKLVSERSDAGASRRERQFGFLMTAVCALTPGEPGPACPQPISMLRKLDARMATGLSAIPDPREAAIARMRIARAHVDIHLPVLSRRSESRTELAVCRSIKTQICRHAFLSLPGDSATAVLFDPDPLGGKGGVQAAPAEKARTEHVLSAVLDTLVNAYLSALGAADPDRRDRPFEPSLKFRLQRVLVGAYPASIGHDAISRYRKAFEHFEKAESDLEEEQTPAPLATRPLAKFYLIDEARAAAWELLTNHRDNLWPQAAAGATLRLLLIDIGAGTTDIAAYDYHAGKPSPFQQTVNVSLPIAGNLLDEAIARDLIAAGYYGAASAPAEGTPNWFALLDRVDISKRCASAEALAIPETLEFGLDEERPAVGDLWRAPEAFAVAPPLEPAQFDGSGPAATLALAPRRAGDPVVWTVFDLRPEATGSANLRSYLALVRDVLVPAAVKAALPQGKASAAGELSVAMCGRACLFRPLREALEAGVLKALPDARAPRLASEILGVTAPEAAAEQQKAVVARGAVAWAREKLRRREANSLGPPALRDACFALLRGRWGGDDGFAAIDRLIDLTSRTTRVEAGEFDLFLVLRPPGLAEAAIKDWLAKTAFERRLAARLLRPMTLFENSKPLEWPRPLAPHEDAGDGGALRLARQGSAIQFSAGYADEDLLLRVEETGKAPVIWRLAGAFADGHTH